MCSRSAQRDIARRIRACPEPSSPAFRALQDFLANDLVGTIGGLLGMWHNHPDGDVTPSDGDLSTALRLRDEYGLSQFVALILPTGEDAWAATTTRGMGRAPLPLGRAVYERVEV